MSRTDLHRPSVIKPEDYVFVSCDYFGGGLEGAAFHSERMAFRAHREKTGGKLANVETNGTCEVCGARALYVARFHYVPGNEYVTTGMDCADKMDIGDPVQFASFRKRVRAGLETTRGKLKARNLLEAAGLDVWSVYTDMEANTERFDLLMVSRRSAETIIWDIVSKVVKYGSVSESQVSFLAKLRQQIADRPAIEAKRAAESAEFAPVPKTDDRIQFEGVVLSTREQEGFRGATVVKMLVQHATGYKLWGSMPSSLEAKKGDTVAFTATVTVSDKDDKFGFFSRPTKARVVISAPVAIEA